MHDADYTLHTDTLIQQYYAHRVLLDERDSMNEELSPLWEKIFVGNKSYARLSEAVSVEWIGSTGRFANIAMYRDGSAVQSIARLAGIFDGTPPVVWSEDAAKADLVLAWKDVLAHVAEVTALLGELRKSADGLKTFRRSAQEEMVGRNRTGWYVRAKTSRRDVRGWVVAEKGNRLTIEVDPLGMLVPIEPANDMGLSSTSRDADRVAGMYLSQTAAMLKSHGTITDTVKFDTSKTELILLLPPEMAEGRASWLSGHLSAMLPLFPAAEEKYEKSHQWSRDTQDSRDRLKMAEEWKKSLPSSIDEMLDTESRRAAGVREALAVLLRNTTFDWETLREAIVSEFYEKHPELVLTQAELDRIAERPETDAITVLDALSKIYIEKNPGGISPRF